MRTLPADILTIDGQIQKTFHILIPRWRLTASLAAAYAHGQTGKPSRNWLAIAVLWAISLTVGPARARWDGGHMQVAAVALADLRRLIVGAPSQAGLRTALFAANCDEGHGATRGVVLEVSESNRARPGVSEMSYHQRPHELRLAISSEADALFLDFGSEAYAEACRRAAEASNDSLARDWSVVAATIARRSGWRPSVLDALFG